MLTVGLMEAYPYLILDARHEQVPDNGEIGRQAVLIAIGINWESDRQALAVRMANRERAVGKTSCCA